MLIDTHAHFDHLSEEAERIAVLERAERAGVKIIVAVGSDPRANACVLALARAREQQVVAAVGYDRGLAGREVSVEALTEQAGLPQVVAIGEIGLDYHYASESAREQRILFGRMLAVAARLRKPVIVHSRDAEADTLAMLREWRSDDDSRQGVLHCFTGSSEFAWQLVELGFYLGFSGIVTFRNARTLRETAASVPLDRIVLETDSPYLAPVPVRGSVNEPAHLKYIAECMAQIRHDSVERIAHSTSQNAIKLFGLNGGEEW